jgi:hypothetical protein
VAREDVQIERGDDRVAQGVLLDQEARIGASLQRREPDAPFVDD